MKAFKEFSMCYRKQFYILLMLSILFPFGCAQDLQSQHELAFETDISFETPLIDFILVKFKLQAELSISPQFTLNRAQNLRDAGTPDIISVSLSPEGSTGYLSIKAVGEKGKVLASHSLTFPVENSPLGEVTIPLPEVGLTLIIGGVTIAPKLIVNSSINSRVEALGPVTISPNFIKWFAEGQKTINVNFQSDKKHVTIRLTDINYVLNTYLQVGVKAIGFEIITINTPSITRTITGAPSHITAGDYNALPTSGFSFTPVKPTAADTVQFTDSSSDDDGKIIAWYWEFGDGTTSTESNPSHKFKVGSYTVMLTVTDDKGATDSKSMTIMISKVPTTLSCEVSTEKVIKGEKVRVSGSITPPMKEIVTLTFTKPDGASIEEEVVSNLDGSYVYEFASDVVGSWRVKASWEGDATYSGAASQTLTFTVAEPPPPSSLKILVKDAKGDPINGASIFSTSIPDGQSSLSGTSGSDGSVTFSEVKPGSYTFQASKSEYVTNSGSVSAKAGETAELVITLEKEAKGGGGIPGFPYESIMLGLVLGALVLWMMQQRK